MPLDGTPGHRMVAYFAEPGTPAYDAMALLGLAASDEAARPTGQAR